MQVLERPNRRANQKKRTRDAVVDAARALLRGGTPPTVAQAAVAAGVSRATAYRYFPTQESLLIEAGNITPMVQPVEELVENLSSDDPEKRLLALLDCFNPIVFAEEVAIRTALRTYLDIWLARCNDSSKRDAPVREGRRMHWLDQVLEPARGRLSDRHYRRLRAALALTVSTDALVVMKDVCRIKHEKDAREVLSWAAVALLRAGLADAKVNDRRKMLRP